MAKGLQGDEVFLALCTPLLPQRITYKNLDTQLSSRWAPWAGWIADGYKLVWVLHLIDQKWTSRKKNNPIRSPYTLLKTGVYKMQTYTHRQNLCLGVDSYSLSPGCTPVLASCQIVPFYGTLPRVDSGSGIWIPPTLGDKWDCWSPATAIGIKDYSVSMDTETGTWWLPKLPGF